MQPKIRATSSNFRIPLCNLSNSYAIAPSNARASVTRADEVEGGAVVHHPGLEGIRGRDSVTRRGGWG